MSKNIVGLFYIVSYNIILIFAKILIFIRQYFQFFKLFKLAKQMLTKIYKLLDFNFSFFCEVKLTI